MTPTAPLKRWRLEDHVNERFPPGWDRLVLTCLQNIEPLEKPDDYPCAQVVHQACACWSYIHRPQGQPDELYDLLNDPQERHNLIDACPEEAQRLASAFGEIFVTGRGVKGIPGRYEIEHSAASTGRGKPDVGSYKETVQGLHERRSVS